MQLSNAVWGFQAVATESDWTFLLGASGNLLDCYYGESEKNIRTLFKIARDRAPSIVFLDEVSRVEHTSSP